VSVFVLVMVRRQGLPGPHQMPRRPNFIHGHAATASMASLSQLFSQSMTLEHDLEAARLVVRAGEGEEPGLDIVGDVGSGKGYGNLRPRAPVSIFLPHRMARRWTRTGF